MTVSRRGFIQQAAAFAALSTGSRAAAGAAALGFAYAGTYTGQAGNGEGIYRFAWNGATGELSERRLAARTESPSWVAVHPSGRYLYAVNEISTYAGTSGSVSGFAVDAATGDLRRLNTVSSEGGGPAYLSFDGAGRFAFVANYGGGSIAVLPILADGRLGGASDVLRDVGSVGAAAATDAPPGSFAVSGHDTPHMHMVAAAPDGRFVLAADLGQDRIYSIGFDPGAGKFADVDARRYVALPTGDGPRHFAFHPNGRWFYSIQEESSTLAFFVYDARTGVLSARQSVSSLPPGFAGTSFASELLIAPDGRFVYAANRLGDSIAIFAIEPDGMLRRVGEASTRGDYPGQAAIAPGGKFLYVCDRRSDCITRFQIDRRTGLIAFAGDWTAVGSPASIAFLAV